MATDDNTPETSIHWLRQEALRKRDPIEFYGRALARRKNQVKWLEIKIKELKAQKE